MVTHIANATLRSALDDMLSVLSGTVALRIFQSAFPSSAGSSGAEVPLVTIFLNPSSPFGAATDTGAAARALMSNLPLSASAIATGTAVWFHVSSTGSGGLANGIIVGNITATGGGGAIEMNQVAVNNGDVVTLNSPQEITIAQTSP